MSKKWQDFLDSLSTTGGGIFVMFLLVAILLSVTIHVLHKGESGQIVTVLVSSFSGAFSALLLALKSNSSKQQMTDRALSVPDIQSEPKP